MERALNPELLAEALGQHERLPTPDELESLLAEAEIDLFFGLDTDHDRLLTAGWYLHAVGAAALEIAAYSANRRQRASQVSAHIFDVYLQGNRDNLTEDEQLRYTVAAQFGYLLGDLTPNATALGSQVTGQHPSIAETPGTTSLYAATLILGLDRRRLREMLVGWTAEVNQLIEQWEDIDTSPFSPSVQVILGIDNLHRFLVTGELGLLELAQASFQRALQSSGGEDDTDSRWVAALLSDLGEHLRISSVWTVLPTEYPAVPRTLVLSDPPVLLFWPPQVRFLQNDPSPLDVRTRRQVLAFPTSAGKTLVSQVLILDHLVREAGDVCVIAPTHSLCREIQDSLASRLSLLRATVADAGPVGSSTGIPPIGRVVVMTPERFAAMLRGDVKGIIDRFSLFIIDEAHLIRERERGWGLEEALTVLHHLTADTEHRIVLVSAAMGAGAHVAAWLETDQPALIRTEQWRGPRRLYTLFTTTDGDAETEPSEGRRLPRRRRPIVGHVSLRKSDTGVVSRQFTEPIGWRRERQQRAGGWVRESGSSTHPELLVPLILHLIETRATPTLVVVATRQQARVLAELVADELGVATGVEVLAERVRSRVGDSHVLPRLLEKGVAYHHGALPTDVQAEVEDAARNRLIRCLVTTATLTEGVNLPFKAVLIGETGYGGGQDRVELIDAARRVNAFGRAGRACKETEGWLILAEQRRYHPQMFNDLQQSGADLPLESSLVSAEALQDLALFESAMSEGRDAVMEDTGRAANDFCSFVWHLAEVLADLERAADLGEILSIIESSLAWQDADAELRDRWRQVAAAAKGSYDATPAPLRRRYASSGLSLAGAQSLEELRSELVDAVHLEAPGDLESWISVLLGGGRLARVLGLPENHLRGFKSRRNAPTSPGIDVDLLDLLQAWTEGGELEELGEIYLHEITDADYRAEALSEFTSSVFEHHLPWVLATLTAWLNEDLASVGSTLVVPPTVATHVHYGVPTPTALEMMTGGIRSRRLAQEVAHQFGPDPSDLRAWLSTLGLSGWRTTLNAFPSELRDLLGYMRRGSEFLCDVLDGGVARVDIYAPNPTASGAAELHDDPSEPAPRLLIVTVDGVPQGFVPSESHQDIQQLIELGVDLDVTFDQSGPSLAITLRTEA